MSVEVIMPQLGDSLTEGTVIRWLKRVGDLVERDDPLFEISTDKVDAEIPSPARGKLARILVQEGETVEINVTVAIIDEPDPQPTAKTLYERNAEKHLPVAVSNEQIRKSLGVPPMSAPDLATKTKSNDKELKQHRIIKCTSWEQFKNISTSELFAQEPFSRGVFLFRGHGSADWPLMSSFDRWFRGIGGNKTLKAKVSEKFISLFQKEAEGMSVEKWIWEDEVARLALAQHYGIPTRLLDWTESPYIAAFFAFSGIALATKPDQHVAVWCLDTRSEIWSKELGAEILEVPSYGNERLRSQLGKFTLLRAPFDTLEEYVSNFEEAEEALFQFLIPSSEARVVLADLDIMGINYSKIFGGLEGCARAARLRMLFNK